MSSVDAPLLTPDGSVTGSTTGPLTQQEEVEPRLLELEQDPPNWRELAPSEVLSKLTKKETKRQEVINGKWMCIPRRPKTKINGMWLGTRVESATSCIIMEDSCTCVETHSAVNKVVLA